MAKDPVCGMDIDEHSAAATSQYQGTTYFFCAPGCKRQFDRDPERFVGASKTSDQRRMPEPGHGGE